MQALGQDSVRSIDIMNINIIHDVYGTYAPAHRVRETVHLLLTHEIPDFSSVASQQS